MRISDWSSDVCSSDLFELVDSRGVDLFEIFGGHFVAGLDVDFTGRVVDEIIGRVPAEDFLGRDQQRVETVLGGLVGQARADLVAGGEDDFAQIGSASCRERVCQYV